MSILEKQNLRQISLAQTNMCWEKEKREKHFTSTYFRRKERID